MSRDYTVIQDASEEWMIYDFGVGNLAHRPHLKGPRMTD